MFKRQHSPEEIGLLNDEVQRGVGSSTLLKVLGPLLDERIEMHLMALETAPANLETLLDLRSRIATLRSIRRELTRSAQVGSEAGERLASIF